MAKGKDRAVSTTIRYGGKRAQTKSHARGGEMTVAEGKTPFTASVKAGLGIGKNFTLTATEAQRILDERARTANRGAAMKRKAQVKAAEKKKLNPNPAVVRTGISRPAVKRTSRGK